MFIKQKDETNVFHLSFIGPDYSVFSLIGPKSFS